MHNHDLQPGSPAHVEALPAPPNARPALLLCDHAGHRVPGGPRTLGVAESQLRRHVGWDIGAADVTRGLARLLRLPALLDHASRLLIDPNRRPGTEQSIPSVSDGCFVPGNDRLDAAGRAERCRQWFLPYHRAIARWVAGQRRAGVVPALLSVHSFTPVMDRQDRPWHAGVLWRNDRRMSQPLLQVLRAQQELVIGDNQPYSGLSDFGYTITFHAQRTRLPHVMVEIRQDQIDTGAKAAAWAERLAAALDPLLDNPELYSLFEGDNKKAAGEIVSWRQASRVSPLA